MKNEHKNPISERFKTLLDMKRTNVPQFSKEVGGTTAKYYKLLKGASNPQFETLEAILNHYKDVSAEWLIRGVGNATIESESVSIEELKKKILEQEQMISNLKTLLRESYSLG